MNERDYMPEQKQMRDKDIFDEWKEAKARFDSACHSLSKAQQERANAEERLRKATTQVASAIETGMYDPTCPMPNIPNPTNGLAGAVNYGMGLRG